MSVLKTKKSFPHTDTATHISPCNLSVDVSWHVSAAIFLLELGLVCVQPVLQDSTFLLELLG